MITSPTFFDWSSPDLFREAEVKKVLANITAFSFPTLFDLQELTKLQAEDEELSSILLNPQFPLKLNKLTVGTDNSVLYCNIQENFIRPYVPKNLRSKIIELFHSSAHPSTKVTDRLIRKQYVWPNMTKNVATYCKSCLKCQKSKISRHNKMQPAQFIAPDARFELVHINIVGPLLDCKGYRYILSMTDRFSRWLEAEPMMDMTAETVSRVFFKTWVCRYGAPIRVTTDQGSQFEARLFNELANIIESQRVYTTPYYPASNGMIERVHRCIKAALMCRTHSTDWVDSLPTVLLGLRNRIIA